ncbi:MAG TPA: SPFH domain-containing protein [Candidatus Paceibacterota bacterium]|nr:SPFH domain-containing protein [Candidatus Paceibacterota bacterium]
MTEYIKKFVIPSVSVIVFAGMFTFLILNIFVEAILAGIASLVIAGVLLLDAFHKVKPLHFSIPLRLGKPTGYWNEGWNIGIPFIDSLDKEFTYTLRPDPMDIKFQFITLDNRKINLDSETRWAPNPKIKDKEGGVPRHAFITKKMMEEGLNDKIDSEIGRIAGGFYWTIFRDERRAVENYINSILRLERPVHVNAEKWFSLMDGYDTLKEEWIDSKFWHNKETYTEKENFSENNENELETEIPFEKRIQFYSHFSNLIGEILREGEDLSSNSDEEIYYGIDIHNFTLGTVSFDKETQNALEEEQRAKDRLKASDRIFEKKMERAKKYKELGIDAQQALNSSEKDVKQGDGNISIVGKGTPIIMEGGKK